MSDGSILEKRLEDLKKNHLNRTLKWRKGIDLSSNDYLGMSEDETLRKRVWAGVERIPLGAAGSRLLRGQLELYDQVEAQLAAFADRQAALLYASGYQANVGFLSALLTESDTVFSDQYNHASLVDGIRLSRAKKIIYPHLDLSFLRASLEKCKQTSGLKVIVTESLFSMDGDFAPLEALANLAQEFSALLIVDEAHATGLWGNFEQKKGSGLVQRLGLSSKVFATIHTGGKSLGVGGAWICGDALLKEYLVNFSRSFIYSTAMVPVVAHVLAESVKFWQEVGMGRAQEVHQKAQWLHQELKERGLISQKTVSPILSVILGSNERALQAATRLQECGFDVRAIRPPTVPVNTARLRVTVNWSLSDQNLQQFVNALQEAV